MEPIRADLPPAIVFQGTTDIAAPVYFELHSKGIPVYYVFCEDDYLSERLPSDCLVRIASPLLDEAVIGSILRLIHYRNGKVVVFPTNETSLNRCGSFEAYDSGDKFHLPGHIYNPEHVGATGITDKAVLFQKAANVFRDLEDDVFKVARTFVLNKNDLLSEFAAALNCYPVIIKPSAKDVLDSFTSDYKTKFLTADGPEDLCRIAGGLFGRYDTSFIVQEKIDFTSEYTWGGMRVGKRCVGAVQKEHIKLPRWGGTGVLTEIVDQKQIEVIAEKILESLGFEGICEISFLRKGVSNYFAYEINPRGWLQVDAWFSAGVDVFSAYYFGLLGIEKTCEREVGSGKKALWASVERYIDLSPAPRWRQVLRMIPHDISLKYRNNKVATLLGFFLNYFKKRLWSL